MGIYLNSSSPASLYTSEVKRPYFVDKTELIAELFPLVEAGNSHICITRPRRFGKTVMANMLGAFFSKGSETGNIFNSLKIAGKEGYCRHLNRHQVVYIDFSKMPRNCKSYEQYIGRIENQLIKDLQKEYPDVESSDKDAPGDVFERIFNEYDNQKFIFILDE